jgi:hypothetical protein
MNQSADSKNRKSLNHPMGKAVTSDERRDKKKPNLKNEKTLRARSLVRRVGLGMTARRAGTMARSSISTSPDHPIS